MGPSISSLNEFDENKPLEDYFKDTHEESFKVSEQFHEPERKLTRREKRAFKNKLKKPEYQKLAKKIIESKTK